MRISFHFLPPFTGGATLVPAMAKSGQYMPQRSQPLHFSGATTCGGWYPLELKAEESASTLVGQNSTQKPQALQRSTTMETRPFATGPPRWKCWALPKHWQLCRALVAAGCDGDHHHT